MALVPVLLALVANLATDTITIPRGGVPWVWTATAVLVVVTVGAELRRHQPGGQPARTGVGLDEATGQLARAVRTQWEQEIRWRRVHTPPPLPVRWRGAPAVMMDHPTNIGWAPAEAPVVLAGQSDRIVETYRRIPSGRLVVLGRAGSGKTVLALRFVLTLLDRPAPDEPVPVIFSLGSWNPATTSLRDWLTERLIRDYPGLAAPDIGGTSLAAALVATGRVLPVLDGFDEIADGLHSAALAGLSATTDPMLMTSRPQEYATAVTAAKPLAMAAAIELDDPTLDDLSDYLPRTARLLAPGDGMTTVWDPVLRHLRDHPDSQAAVNLVTALSTPLMIGLARAIYSDTPDHDPAELLDTNRFGTAQALEDHLLGAFLPTVYRHPPLDRLTGSGQGQQRVQRYDPDGAKNWLGYLAHHLNRLDTRDLAWWELGKIVSMYPLIALIVLTRILSTALMAALGLLIIAINSSALHLTAVPITFGQDFTSKALYGLATGAFAASISLGGMMTFPSRGEFRPSRIARISFTLARVPVVVGFTAFLGVAGWLIIGLHYDTQVGILCGLTCGLTFGILIQFSTSADIESTASPVALLTMDRKNITLQVLVCWMVFELALIFGITVDAGGGYGFGLGTLTALVINSLLAVSVWFRWLIFARCALPLAGRLPWRVVAFLEDAHRRGVLRQAGAVYQFRHARLQDHLAREYEGRRGQRKAG